MNDALVTLSSLARRLRVPVGWLREEAASGRVPALRAGRQFLFHPKAVERVLVDRAAQGNDAQAQGVAR